MVGFRTPSIRLWLWVFLVCLAEAEVVLQHLWGRQDPGELTHWVAEVTDDECYVVHASTLPTSLDRVAKVGRHLRDHFVGHLVDAGGVV